MLLTEWVKTPEGQRATRRAEESARALEIEASKPKPTMPMKDLVTEALSLVRALGHDAMKERISHIHDFTNPSHFAETAGHLRQSIEAELSGSSNDLEARLVKQAQSLDHLYDFFVQLSQYTLTEGIGQIQGSVNLALRAQSQCASTIDKFRKLQEKRFKNAERTEQIAKRTEQHAQMD